MEEQIRLKSDGLELEEMHAWSDLSKLFKTFAAYMFRFVGVADVVRVDAA